MKSNDELSVYLKDHFAGGVGAIELLGHLFESHEDRDLKAFYRELLADVEADHETLNRLMTELGIRRRPHPQPRLARRKATPSRSRPAVGAAGRFVVADRA